MPVTEHVIADTERNLGPVGLYTAVLKESRSGTESVWYLEARHRRIDPPPRVTLPDEGVQSDPGGTVRAALSRMDVLMTSQLEFLRRRDDTAEAMSSAMRMEGLGVCRTSDPDAVPARNPLQLWGIDND